jgi:hypothetical protein
MRYSTLLHATPRYSTLSINWRIFRYLVLTPHYYCFFWYSPSHTPQESTYAVLENRTMNNTLFIYIGLFYSWNC